MAQEDHVAALALDNVPAVAFGQEFAVPSRAERARSGDCLRRLRCGIQRWLTVLGVVRRWILSSKTRLAAAARGCLRFFDERDARLALNLGSVMNT
jgi:hypothetical protein